MDQIQQLAASHQKLQGYELYKEFRPTASAQGHKIQIMYLYRYTIVEYNNNQNMILPSIASFQIEIGQRFDHNPTIIAMLQI